MSLKTLVSLLVLVLLVVPGSVGVIAADPAVAFSVTNNGFTSYTIDGNSNPTLNLVRGQTYTFEINAPGHPFWIKTVQSTGTANAYSDGVTGNGTDSGTLTFTVPAGAPSTLFYDCQFHSSMTGQINITGSTPTERMTWGRLKALF